MSATFVLPSLPNARQQAIEKLATWKPNLICLRQVNKLLKGQRFFVNTFCKDRTLENEAHTREKISLSVHVIFFED